MPSEEMPDRAAYSASQPLYDALKTAVQRVEVARQLLENAMLAVRNENVRTNSDKILRGSAPQESYVDDSILAWRGITTAFTSVFQELSSLSEPRLDEGRPERPGHHHIRTLHSTTKTAQHAAHVVPVRRERRPRPIAKPQTRRPDPSKPVPKGANKKRKLSNVGGEQHPAKVRCFEDSQKSPAGDSRKTPPKNVDEHLDSLHISPVRPQQHNEGYTVQYEDVSAEVEARLAAKEKSRTEKKGDPKRKRVSTHSLNLQDPSDKPAQKKARRRSGTTKEAGQFGSASHGIKRGSPQNGLGPNKKLKIDQAR